MQVTADLNELIQQSTTDTPALGFLTQVDGILHHAVEHGAGRRLRSADPAEDLRVIVRLHRNKDRRHDLDVLKLLKGQRPGLVGSVAGVEALLVDLAHLRVVRRSEWTDAEILLLVFRVVAHGTIITEHTASMPS